MSENVERLMDLHYTWDAVDDIENDVNSALNENDVPGEFKGLIRVRVDFIKDETATSHLIFMKVPRE